MGNNGTGGTGGAHKNGRSRTQVFAAPVRHSAKTHSTHALYSNNGDVRTTLYSSCIMTKSVAVTKGQTDHNSVRDLAESMTPRTFVSGYLTTMFQSQTTSPNSID